MKRIYGAKIASFVLGLAIAVGVNTVNFEQSKVFAMADVSETDRLIANRDSKTGKIGYLDIKGAVVIPYQFDSSNNFPRV